VRYNPIVKRLRRILLNAATAVSLLLALAVAVLWVRSEIIIQDQLQWNIYSSSERRSSAFGLRSRLGEVAWSWYDRVFATREYFDIENPVNRPAAPDG